MASDAGFFMNCDNANARRETRSHRGTLETGT
jgi:hypothetical protein